MSTLDPTVRLPVHGRTMILTLPWTCGVFEVPAGFETDLASVPRPLWWIVARWGNHSHAAILHDYLYREQPVDRRTADRMFRRRMELDGVNGIKRWTMWVMVRLFGAGAWRRRSAYVLREE